MSHLDEGAILTLRDGGLVSADAEAHLHHCSDCSASLALADERSIRIARALESLDVGADLEAAKERARAALDDRTATRRPHVISRWHLGRAAAILLLTAGAAYAVPGSPFRDWVNSRVGPSAGTETSVSSGSQDYAAGIDVAVVDGSIRISLTSVAEDTRLDVVWIDEAVARISGSAGSSYSVAQGSAEADVTPGPVRVALPRSASLVVLEVNGSTILQRSESGLELLEEPVSQNDDRIVFSITPR
jgi:hypothetical protein